MDSFAHERSGRLTEGGLSVVAASGMAQQVVGGELVSRIDCVGNGDYPSPDDATKSGNTWAIHEPNRHHTAGALRHTCDDRGRRSRGDVVVYVYILLAR